ncbi:P-loop containing nucleoside triphosphate hydrolase protein [Corynespora cassiicola Philippines]|uniref:DNA 3'-5' helicase n=1 Tax=Corynespora cassiicola Philippines TaxID=1448308 RepID=A0A2T2NX18_CORCC|nr:P-loop containing nucleoside triphosphate hydrolase protein [Corynespora cassiicola Philippines]
MDALLDGLNDAQKSAVLAPPGSGKTKTLTTRVAYLINHERLRPWNIIERIRGFVGDGIESKLILGTFHSIGIPKNFGIADTNDSKAIIKRIITRQRYNFDPAHAPKGISAEQFATTTKKADQHEFLCIYTEYEDTLKASNLLDYDDLLLRCADLLRRHPTCASGIEAVLIDEYQDTNNLLAQQTRHQKIKNLLRMREDYPESIVINLENNYRSSGCILTTALAVIEQDDSRPNKPLIATHCVGEQPTLRHLATASLEAQWIVQEIRRSKTLASGLLNLNDYAILVRSSTLSSSIERMLGREGIPYRMVGGTRFFDRAEIKPILDYLRVINQPEHNDALVRIINVPSRQIGDVTVKALLEEAESKKCTLWKLILDCAQGRSKPRSKISTQAQKGIDEFVNLILTSRKKLLPPDGEKCDLFDLITHILQKTSYEAYLKKTHKENWQERWDNVEELGTQASQMTSAILEGGFADDTLPEVDGVEQRADTAADVLSKFLANVALTTERETSDGEIVDQVTISTIHAAKGLEWPVVFIPAVYDGSIPHSRAEDHDEERRLLYVDLSQILHRPCPGIEDVEAARKLLERVEDDQYPLTREEIDGEDTEWNSYASKEGNQPPWKRRRTDDFNSARSSNTVHSVTMQNTPGFSVSTATMRGGIGGFTTARDLKTIQDEAESVRMLASAANANASQATSKGVQENKTKSIQRKGVKPRPTGQGSITSFFSRPGGTVSEEPVPTTRREATLKRSQSSTSHQAPLVDISNVQRLSSQPSQPSRPYQPPSFSSHRPRSTPMMGKPKKLEAEPEEASTKYVLLSSSPVKTTDDDEDGSPERAKVKGDAGVVDSPTKKPCSPGAASEFRPASTFHSTSVGQLHSRTGPPRALGMRRPMQSWSAKHTQLPRPRQQ